MTIVFASDHAGFCLREELSQLAREMGHETLAVGAMSEEPYDYPDAADAGSAIVLNGQATFGVFICGSGTGICMRANRHNGIRGANCTSVALAKMSRKHNHANVLCLGQRTTPPESAKRILEAFLGEPEDDSERHVRRVGKLDWNG